MNLGFPFICFTTNYKEEELSNQKELSDSFHAHEVVNKTNKTKK